MTRGAAARRRRGRRVVAREGPRPAVDSAPVRSSLAAQWPPDCSAVDGPPTGASAPAAGNGAARVDPLARRCAPSQALHRTDADRRSSPVHGLDGSHVPGGSHGARRTERAGAGRTGGEPGAPEASFPAPRDENGLEQEPGDALGARPLGRSGDRVRVALVEDHQLFAASMSAALRAEGFEPLVAPMQSLAGLLNFLEQERPHVALLDVDLGAVGSGTAALPVLTGVGAIVIVVSGTADEADIGECLEAGAHGWVPKSAAYDVLLEAVLAAADGRPVCSDDERDRLVRAARNRRRHHDAELAPFDRLSPREAEVLALLMRGAPVERIAAGSFVSPSTVRTQVRAILVKLGVRSQLEAVAMATQAGWSPPS